MPASLRNLLIFRLQPAWGTLWGSVSRDPTVHNLCNREAPGAVEERLKADRMKRLRQRFQVLQDDSDKISMEVAEEWIRGLLTHISLPTWCYSKVMERRGDVKENLHQKHEQPCCLLHAALGFGGPAITVSLVLKPSQSSFLTSYVQFSPCMKCAAICWGTAWRLIVLSLCTDNANRNRFYEAALATAKQYAEEHGMMPRDPMEEIVAKSGGSLHDPHAEGELKRKALLQSGAYRQGLRVSPQRLKPLSALPPPLPGKLQLSLECQLWSVYIIFQPDRLELCQKHCSDVLKFHSLLSLMNALQCMVVVQYIWIVSCIHAIKSDLSCCT